MIRLDMIKNARMAQSNHRLQQNLRSDNQGVIGALAAGRSHGRQANAVLQHIIRLFHKHNIWFSITYVASKDNTADTPSRRKLPPCKDQYQYPPKLPTHLNPYIYHSMDSALWHLRSS
ncbi:hypothetical protein B0H19DRAFT_925843 [Mycena capillaripes]|nr:hypothetical protein B0H19DRAFT_925843 [Mycena capillaripes]